MAGKIEPGDLVSVRGYDSLRRVVGVRDEVFHLPLEPAYSRMPSRNLFQHVTLVKKARYDDLDRCRSCFTGEANASGICGTCEAHEAAMADTP